MYETMDDVPSVVADFYCEEIRNEVMLDEEGEPVTKEEFFIYVDEGGEKQVGTNIVVQYVDNVYIVEIATPRMEEFSRLTLIVDKNSLVIKKREFIDTSTRAYLDSIQWLWFTKYKGWQTSEPEEPIKAKDEFGQFIPDDPTTPYNEYYVGGKSYAELILGWKEKEPKRPLNQTVANYQGVNYEYFRRYASYEDQEAMRYDDYVNSTTLWLTHNLDVKTRWPKLETTLD